MIQIKKINGFTLAELMIVLIIMGAISAIAYPRIMLTVERSEAQEAVQNLTAVLASQNRYNLRNGTFFGGAGTAMAGQLDITLPASNHFAVPMLYNAQTVGGTASVVAAITSNDAETAIYRIKITTTGTLRCDNNAGAALPAVCNLLGIATP